MVRDDRGHVTVNDVSLEVRAGEIVAIAGVQGNGQEELVEALLGLRSVDRGTITLHGNQLVGRETHGILRDGVGFVPEDRQHNGLVGQLSVAENLVLDLYDRDEFSQGLRLRLGAIRANAERRIDEFDMRTPSASVPAGALSGGNQQKVVLAREMSRPLSLLVASQPTRGVDVGAQEFIHSRIVAERDRGTPVVIISTELDEVLALADRIVVIYRGQIIGSLPGDASRDEVGLMMAGVPAEEARTEAEEHPSLLTVSELQRPVGRRSVVTTAVETKPAPPTEPEHERPPRNDTWLVTLLAIVVALVIGGLMMIFSDDTVRTDLGYFFQHPSDFFRDAWYTVRDAYKAMFEGAIYDPNNDGTVSGILGPITSSIFTATPLILAGLGVSLAFRAGLFNIGGEGQVIAGAIAAGYVGFAWSLPPFVHLVVAMLAGLLGGAVWGFIAGFLKARTGAHEVITTIMLNYIAAFGLLYLLSLDGSTRRTIRRPASRSRAPLGCRTSSAPASQCDLGIVVAVGAAALVWWMLTRSTIGFRLRAVGRQPGGVANGRHERRRDHDAGHDGRGRPGRTGRHDARSRRGDVLRGHAEHLVQRRLRRDHRRTARSNEPMGHRLRRPAVRCVAPRRGRDAGGGRQVRSTSSRSSRR